MREASRFRQHIEQLVYSLPWKTSDELGVNVMDVWLLNAAPSEEHHRWSMTPTSESLEVAEARASWHSWPVWLGILDACTTLEI